MNPCIEFASKKIYELGKGAEREPKERVTNKTLGRVVNSKHLLPIVVLCSCFPSVLLNTLQSKSIGIYCNSL